MRWPGELPFFKKQQISDSGMIFRRLQRPHDGHLRRRSGRSPTCPAPPPSGRPTQVAAQPELPRSPRATKISCSTVMSADTRNVHAGQNDAPGWRRCRGQRQRLVSAGPRNPDRTGRLTTQPIGVEPFRVRVEAESGHIRRVRGRGGLHSDTPAGRCWTATGRLYFGANGIRLNGRTKAARPFMTRRISCHRPRH